MSMYGRTGAGGMLPPSAFGQRDQIARTMMNIGSPPPQVQPGGLPPGMHMAETPLKSLMGVPPGMSPGFMGGEPSPMPGAAPPAAPPPQQPAPTTPVMPPAPPPQQPAPSSLFALPPAVPGQAPPQFAKPPTY